MCRTNWPSKFLTHRPIRRTIDPPNLYSRVHVVVDVVILQHTVTVVVEVDPDLLTQPQRWSVPLSAPDAAHNKRVSF